MNLNVTFGESESEANATLYSSNQTFTAGFAGGSGGVKYEAGENISIEKM